ncbi:MAG: tRNA pseudouridine(38-40) synthase TruA [Candidatus Rhabdochlamydia sp.]
MMETKRNLKMTIAYDGTPYLGWQKNNAGASIEECLQTALQQVLQEDIALSAASRTDAGVHAKGQVVNFFTTRPLCLHKLQRSLNSLLDDAIAVLNIEEVPMQFHSTLHSIKKEYWYHICFGRIQNPFFRRTSWHFPRLLELDEMQKAAHSLIGEHDFSAFCNARSLWNRGTVCHLKELSISLISKDRMRFIILGDHFLYKMVRNLVGTLAYVGCTKLVANQISNFLTNKDHSQIGMTAPSHGLVLKKVYYS